LTVTNCHHNSHQPEEQSWLRRRKSNVNYLYNFITKLIYCRDVIFFCSRPTLSILPAVVRINSVVHNVFYDCNMIAHRKLHILSFVQLT
jgi:hypothetical protein